MSGSFRKMDLCDTICVSKKVKKPGSVLRFSELLLPTLRSQVAWNCGCHHEWDSLTSGGKLVASDSEIFKAGFHFYFNCTWLMSNSHENAPLLEARQ